MQMNFESARVSGAEIVLAPRRRLARRGTPRDVLPYRAHSIIRVLEESKQGETRERWAWVAIGIGALTAILVSFFG